LQRTIGNQAVQRMLQHGLTHVVQQSGFGSSIQRAPTRGKSSSSQGKTPQLASSASSDEVLKVERVGDNWEVKVAGYTDAGAVWLAFWDSGPPPGIGISPIVVATEPAQVGLFKLTGLTRDAVSKMRPSVAKRFTDIGLIEEQQETVDIVAARAAFRERHKDHDKEVLDNIDAALKRVTKGNHDLLLAYYKFYSDFTLTDDLESSDENLGVTDQTFLRSGFTDLNRGLLQLEDLPKAPTDDRSLLLGETLLHEFSHTSQLGNPLKGPTEGKAYGIENFFAERAGDRQRDATTLRLGGIKGDQTAFDTAYTVIKELYQVIDGSTATSSHLKGVSVARAREMAVAFISRNKEDFSEELTKFMAARFSATQIGSLP
jgi:hypothetical protein